MQYPNLKLGHVERQNSICIKYILCQSATIVMMIAQFIYLMLTLDNVDIIDEQEEIIDTQHCLNNNGIIFDNLKIYSILTFECYIPVLTYFILSLFCCQLCQVDKKLTGYRNRIIKQSFKLRLIIRIVFQIIICTILILQFIELLQVDNQIEELCYNNTMLKLYDRQLFYPCTINLIIFLFIVTFDNSYYFIIVCYTSNFYWGCYHDEELPIISVVETQSFSFAKDSSQSSSEQQRSQDEKQSPYFGI